MACYGPSTGRHPLGKWKGKKHMHIIKRGLLALSVLAAVGGTTGGLLATQAGASPTRGVEIVHTVQYSVNGGPGVGPWTGRGPINSKVGNITDVASLTTDPANSSRTTLVTRLGASPPSTPGATSSLVRAIRSPVPRRPRSGASTSTS